MSARLLALFLLLGGVTPGQEAPLAPAGSDLRQHYLILSANKIRDGQRLLEEAAAAGYRLLLAGSVGGERRLVLEKSAGSSGAFQYRVFSKELEPALQQAAADGFRFHRRAFPGMAAVERAPGSAGRYQYRVLETNLKSTMEKELNQAAREGWEPIALAGLGLARTGGVFLHSQGQFAVLEKSVETQVDPGVTARAEAHASYLLLAAGRIATLQKELTEKAAQGYRVRLGFLDGDESAYVLEREEAPPEPCEYLLISTGTEKLEKAMNEAAGRGFRVHPEGMFLRFPFPAGFRLEMVVLMEKTAGAPARFEYRVLSSGKVEKLQNQLAEAQGFRVVGMIGYETIIVERARE